MVKRALKHLFTPHWVVARAFPPATLRRVEHAIKDSERSHRGEIRFAVEGPLHVAHLRATPRTRAHQVFSDLRVWDTAENTGVLIYVQLVDRAIEIIADRGIAARVPAAEWQAICRAIQRAFKDGKYEEGALGAIAAVTGVLAREFPASGAHANELPDKPVVL